MGYVIGLGLGATYGAVRPSLGHFPMPLAGVTLGALAMAASDVPAIQLGVTDPKEWGTAGWLADIVPHVVYGFITAMAFDAFTAGPLGRRSTPPGERLAAAVRHSARYAHL
jgi:hypothetical protein